MKQSMKLVSSLAVMSVFLTTAHSQTIGGLSIGQTTDEVRKEYGSPDKISAWSSGPAWEYDFGPKLKVYVVFSKTSETVIKLSAIGDLDRRGIFRSRLGVKVGDSQQKVVSAYGQGEIIGEDTVTFSRKYSNIQFTFQLSEAGSYFVQRIEVFPTKKTSK